ncbi:hypothetical protein AAY473_040574 [Plecturocebus cupreus]
MKRPLSRCSRHAPEVREGRAEIAVTRRAATEQTRELQLQPLRRARPGPRRCRRRRPAWSRGRGRGTNREEEKNAQLKRRMEGLQVELREQEAERKDTETSRRPQHHLEVEANSLPELLDRKFEVLPDFRQGLPKLGTNS